MTLHSLGATGSPTPPTGWAEMRNHRAARWTIGRLSNLTRVPFLLVAGAISAIKTAGQGIFTGVTGDYFNTSENTKNSAASCRWTFHKLKRAIKDTAFAPEEGYQTFKKAVMFSGAAIVGLNQESVRLGLRR